MYQIQKPSNTSAKLARLADTVTTWYTAREDQGQMIEISCGRTDDGDIIERTIDRSGPETSYRIIGGSSDDMPVD